MAMTEGLGVTPVYNLDNKNDDGFFGGGGSLIFFLFFLLAWGGGNGFGGGFGSGAGGAANMINNDFLYTNLKTTLDNGFTQQANQAFGLSRDIQAGFASIGNGLCNTTYEITRGLDGVSRQISDCCCTTNRNIDAVRYDNERNTCSILTNADRNARDIIDANNYNTQRLVDMFTQDKIENLRTELQSAQFQLSQNAQTSSIINQIKPCPIPAYPSCNPWGCNGGLCGGSNLI